MAIKIIKHGQLILRATCPRCDCIFEFMPSDMDIKGPLYAPIEFINCPECGNEITWWYEDKSGRKYEYV